MAVTFALGVATAVDEANYIGRDHAGKNVLKGHAKRSVTISGPLAGTHAWVEQMVDKTATPQRYKKKVTLSDGTVDKDVDGRLSDQGLHGPGPRHTRPPDDEPIT